MPVSGRPLPGSVIIVLSFIQAFIKCLGRVKCSEVQKCQGLKRIHVFSERQRRRGTGGGLPIRISKRIDGDSALEKRENQLRQRTGTELWCLFRHEELEDEV